MRENSGPPAFAWRIPGLQSETWGTHQLIQEVLSQTLTSRAMFRAGSAGLSLEVLLFKTAWRATFDNRISASL